jgi:hypothetical protein
MGSGYQNNVEVDPETGFPLALIITSSRGGTSRFSLSPTQRTKEVMMGFQFKVTRNHGRGVKVVTFDGNFSLGNLLLNLPQCLFRVSCRDGNDFNLRRENLMATRHAPRRIPKRHPKSWKVPGVKGLFDMGKIRRKKGKFLVYSVNLEDGVVTKTYFSDEADALEFKFPTIL